jgi:membrane protein required for beta-lactamase induction
MRNSFETFAALIGLVAIVIVLLGYPLMLLWNWLMPIIFGLPEITFWQAIGLNLLSTILFKPTTIKNKD